MADTYRTPRQDRGSDPRGPRRPRNAQPAPPDQDGRVKGVVKNLQADKGWGFVSDANGFDYFFHYSALPDGVELSHLYEGQEVSWRPSDSDRGPRAEQLMIGG